MVSRDAKRYRITEKGIKEKEKRGKQLRWSFKPTSEFYVNYKKVDNNAVEGNVVSVALEINFKCSQLVID